MVAPKATLFPDPDAGPPAPARGGRVRLHPCRHLYVRKVGGRKYQARVWLPAPLGSVNLGLYDDEAPAWRAVRAWIAAGADPCRGLPPGVLPKWVRDDGRGGFLGRRATAEGFSLAGPFPTPEEAHHAVRAGFAEGRAELRFWFQPTLLEVSGLA